MRHFLPKPAPIQPMPQVKMAHCYMSDVEAAVERLRISWNPTQANDAIRSLRLFIDRIDEVINAKD